MQRGEGGGKISAPVNLEFVSRMTVTSYRRKIWLLYLFLYSKKLMHVSEDK